MELRRFLERWSERKIDSVDVGGRLLEASAGGLLVGGKLLAGWGAPDSVRTRFRTLAHCEAEAQVEMWDAGGTVEEPVGVARGGSPVGWSDCRSDSQSCDSDRLTIAGEGSCRAAGSQRVDLAQVWRC
jgi:hypothetical protein